MNEEENNIQNVENDNFIEDIQDAISLDDLKKVEIKVGEILKVEKVENADKLLRLEVDFGDHKRQIVSGIAEHFSIEQLIGVKCPFFTNLEPRTIRGLKSFGMIMAAKDDGGNFSLLNINKSIKNGTKIS